MHLDPAALSHADRYKLLIGGVVPRPIAWVSTLGVDGSENLAPFSFFNGVSASPMLLMFCPANNADGSEKDTLRNAKPRAEGGTGECVINVVPDTLVRPMALCAEGLPYGESEFRTFGIEREPSVIVKPARVKGSPLSFECVTERVLRFGPGLAGAGNMIIVRVVGVHAQPGVLNDRLQADPAALDAVGRMGGITYARTRERFELPMGRS